MRIQHNIMAMNAYRNYGNNTSALSKNLEKLSSGYKINRAGDDAAGLAISEKMRAQIQGLNAAQKNVKDAISFVKTAEGAMQEIQDMLSRMKYLATQSANGTYENKVDRKALQDEVDSLLEEINRIAQSANFNDIFMLSGPVSDDDSGAGAVIGEEQQAAIDAIAAAITAGTGYTEGTGGPPSEAKQLIDFSGLSFENAGKVKVTLGGQSYEVEVTEGMTGAEFATALAAAYNGGTAIHDNNGGDFGVSDGGDGKLTFEAEDSGALANSSIFKDFAIEEIEDSGDDDEIASSYTVAITDSATNTALAAADSIKIGGHTYTLGSGGGDIDVLTATTLEDQIKAAIALYDTENDAEWDIEYADGVLTFTAKDGVTPTSAPVFELTEDAGKLTVGEMTPVKTGGGDDGVADTKTDYNKNLKPADKTLIYNITMQIGDTSEKYNQLTMDIRAMTTDSLGITGLKISNVPSANSAIDIIKNAINDVSSVRGKLGAYQNRLEHTQNNLSVMTENIQDAESTIRDTDVAEEMMSYTKNNILIQSAQAMLAQANAVPQGVLQLLG